MMHPTSLRGLAATLASLAFSASAAAQSDPGNSVLGVPLAPIDAPAPVADGEPRKLSVAATLTVASHYAFQGIDYSAGEPVLQPGLELAWGGITASAWSNQSMESGEIDELDFGLTYGRSWGELYVAAGVARLVYPHRTDWEASHELVFEAEYAGPVTPVLAIHSDFGAGNGWYSTFGLAAEIPTALVAVALAVQLHQQTHYYESTGIPAAEFGVGISQTVGTMTMSPKLSYLATWNNGDFTADAAVPASWLFAMEFAWAP